SSLSSRHTGCPSRLEMALGVSMYASMNALRVGSHRGGGRAGPNLKITKQTQFRPGGLGPRRAAGCCGGRFGRIPCTPSQPPGRSVHYISTRDGRSRPERLGFDDMLLSGLAPDGGLFVPEQWPSFNAEQIRAL